MNPLSDLDLKTTYRKGRDNIAEDFYIPCLSRAQNFDRAVGFFSSSIYSIAWEGLKQFISNSGKIRVICSPILSPADTEALSEGYTKRLEEESIASLTLEIQNLFADPARRKPATVLANLVNLNILDLRIALMSTKGSDLRRIFHDKVGVFYDNYNNMVAFKGSMNETWSGLSSDGNLESVDVFVSWSDARDRDRVENSIFEFNALWNNEFPTVIVRDFPDVLKENLIRIADPSKLDELIDEIIQEIQSAKEKTPDPGPGGHTPRLHQLKAINGWEAQGRRGIFEHATGSGKTFTALIAIKDGLVRGESILVIVPSELLLLQWAKEISETLATLNPSILLCGGGNDSWKDPGILAAYTRKRAQGSSRIVISTIQTATSDEFLSRVEQGNHLFIIVDEVHRAGSTYNRRLFGLNTGPRLGLSATPHRYGDPIGTEALLTYFGGVVPPPFTLDDAIKSDALTPYFYFSHPVALSLEEQEEWNNLTKKIQTAYARNIGNPNQAGSDYCKQLLIQRSHIAKSASGKIPLAGKVLSENYQEGQRWIVYCDSQNQIIPVLSELRRVGINALEYHTGMAGDRERTLSHFINNGGVLVSIKCLDEGVDIPSVTHALILASSKNPREFIQRRGRVLRKATGKLLAFVHDAIVIPNSLDEVNSSDAMLLAEIARATKFAASARNPSSINDIQLIALRSGLDPNTIMMEGVEDDTD